ncbi:MAG: hypothetical protein GQ570_05115 [Helicobacteraceae bacterium]|nr:hypothetical protein [Helicobacteraceae bacterium]
MKNYIYRRIPDTMNLEEEKKRLINHASTQDIKVLEDDITLCPIRFSQFKQNTLLDKTIKKLSQGDTFIVDSLKSLGSSSIHILKRLDNIKNRRATLYLDKQDFILKPDDDIFKILNSLLHIEAIHKTDKNKAARATLIKNKTTRGRKKAKRVKSIFDKHKSKIMKYETLGVTKKKIIENIGIGNAQALSKYIKRIKEELTEKEKLAKIQKKQGEAYFGQGMNLMTTIG